ncbi:restriction endonuclease subunit S [Collimonas pratensis]|uniref:Type I restriction modification DNA specificity domain protein n=1 Tax=Collimonas pratensis TaxID=279113 RepID=A0ABM5YZT8_9BURK|nr:restriction endonuclease subunit S [Collimonas pratensis]AMP12303.1 type I restriction modification DNA specificity domain protein [Collimonas pratensis]
MSSDAQRPLILPLFADTVQPEWLWKRLDEIAEVYDCPHSTPQLVDDQNAPFVVRSQDVRTGTILLGSAARVSIETYRERIKRVEPEFGDLVYSREGTYFGIAAEVPRRVKVCLGQRMVLIRPDNSRIDHAFLKYWLNSPQVFGYIHGFRDGTVAERLNLPVIRGMAIAFPSLAEQSAIAEVLGTLDDRIALLRETNTTLEAIAQALFKSWFVDFDPVRAKQQGREQDGLDATTTALFPDSFEESKLGLVPRGWEVKRLGDITERITKGTTPTTLKRPFVESGINFVKVESLTEDGEFIPGKFAYVDNATHELLKRSQLKVDDVLITIAGTIGRIAVMTEDFLPANTNQAVALIRPDANLFPGGLIKHFLQREDSRQTMGERVVQAVQANLSLGSLSDLLLVVPPVEVVKKLYGAGIEQIDACKRMNQQQIRTLTSIRDTLLPRLISGQLRLPEAAREMETEQV